MIKKKKEKGERGFVYLDVYEYDCSGDEKEPEIAA